VSTPFLEVEELETHFPVETGLIVKRRLGEVRAVDGVRLSVKQGEVLGVVGESGCAIHAWPDHCSVDSSYFRDGHSRRAEFESAPRAGVAPRAGWFPDDFQDPYSSLNPRLNVFDTLAEAMRAHKKIPRRVLRPRVTQLMPKVGLLPHTINKYPHEFSGGQRQRIAIARAPRSRN
jgi:ABC-type microcin C transport system duplicated ATPase subunit YejF